MWRLGGWCIIIVIDKERRPLLARALRTTTSKPEEEEEGEDQETSYPSYDATYRGYQSESSADKRTRAHTNNGTNVCSRPLIDLSAKLGDERENDKPG